MKALIISFFSIILGYSFFFDNNDSKKTLPAPPAELSVTDMDGDGKVFYSDTIEYFARKRDASYLDRLTRQIF